MEQALLVIAAAIMLGLGAVGAAILEHNRPGNSLTGRG